MDALGESEVTQTVHVPLLKQLLCCVDAIVKTAGPLCSQHSEAIFIILLRLQASSGDQQGLVEEVSHVCCSVYSVYIYMCVCECLCECVCVHAYAHLCVHMHSVHGVCRSLVSRYVYL